MERNAVDHITSLLNMSANVAAQNYPSLAPAIGELVEAYNSKITHTQRAAVLALLESFRRTILYVDKK